MGAKKGRPKAKSGRDDIAVKIDRIIGDKARFVASRRGTTLAEYLSDLLRSPVERDFAKELKEIEPN
jgi:hypothetical protein